jgi:hypothetical protein|tara:strand:+ start:137 stop:265 length:129 start_codon:yes stop_codon:yes gene_type:complete
MFKSILEKAEKEQKEERALIAIVDYKMREFLDLNLQRKYVRS